MPNIAVLFNSYIFLFVFLPVTLAGYYTAVRCGRRAAMIWLIAASFVFYGWWNPAFVPLLAGSIAFNYAASCLIAAAEQRPRLQTGLTVGAVAADLAALVYFKYAIWLLGLLGRIGLVRVGLDGIVLPLGISFFTFTQIGYLLDCRHDIARHRGLLEYVVFVTFFPHLIAGPILHNGEMMPQFADPATYRFVPAGFAAGCGLFVAGLLKKCLLADPVGAVVPVAYSHPDLLALFPAWQAALSYSLQLYFDFSGYSDMAIGLALMFNLRFPLNFNSPYKARSVVDYWQRWHMTLTRYFTQYLYNPLALAAMRRRIARRLPVNRAAQVSPSGFTTMAAMPIFVTIVLAGVWHGAGMTFLVFGLLHACFLTINRACRIAWPNPSPPGRLGVLWRVLLTYLAVLVGSVFFRAPSVPAAVAMLAGMAGLHGIGPALSVPAGWLSDSTWLVMLRAHGMVQAVPWHTAASSAFAVLRIAVLYLWVWTLPNTQQIFAAGRPALGDIVPPRAGWLQWHPARGWAIALGCATALAALSIGGTGEFLYFQF